MKSETTELENLFLALADGTRLRLLKLLDAKEICVFDFATALNEPQPKISRHLAFLRRMKIVETTRHGKFIYYRIAQQQDKERQRILRETLNCLKGGDAIKNDAEDSQKNAAEKRRGSVIEDTEVVFDKTNLSNQNSLPKPQKRDELAVFLL